MLLELYRSSLASQLTPAQLLTLLAEQQALIRPVIKLLKCYKFVVLGDREFHSVEHPTKKTSMVFTNQFKEFRRSNKSL
ncbi:MAG: hypothetical protein IGR93_12775 [Hydrococcus sp. C42_A2020_068]|nr:hypothetical protein [Hydrococcus sp. C42_A2020_068]